MDAGGLGQAKLLNRSVEGVLEPTSRHRHGCCGSLTTSWTADRKEPDWMAMGGPAPAYQGQGAGRQRHVAIFIALTTLDMQLHTGAVNLRNLEADAFQQPQATGIDGAQADPVMWQPDLVEDTPDLIRAEHYGQLVLLGWPHEGQGWPVALEGVLEEELDATQCHRTGVAGSVFLVAEVEKVLTELLLSKKVRGDTIMVGQLLHRLEMGLLGTGSQPPQLHVLEHALA